MIPVVDVSRHQGAIDFTVMRSKGVRGLILRASHGRTADDRAGGYYRDALAAGFAANEAGWYSFINPKRGSGRECAEATASLILSFTGWARPAFYMLDIEQYANEPPSTGAHAWTPGPAHRVAFSAWLREHIATMRELLPDTPIVAYSNAAFYDGNVGDFELAASLEWIVPRYPVSSPAGYQRFPLPPTVDGWEQWAHARAPQGPRSPMGVPWAGWQFSAGYNAQGPVYGCDSAHLDLNIVHPEAWARWTTDPATIPTPSPPVPVEDDMPAKLIRVDGDAAVFAESGLQAVWGRSAAHIAEKQSTGAWSMDPPKVVTRDYLRSLILVGDEPDYSTGDGGLPGRTTRADFAPTPSVPPPVLTGTLTVTGDVHVVG